MNSIFSALLPVSFAIIAATGFAHAHAHAGRERVAPRAPITLRTTQSSVLLPGTSAAQETVYILPAMTVTASATARARAKIWSCGPVEANAVGGSQRTCEWVTR